MTERRLILLVDDNQDDRALAEAAFMRLGVDHELATAEDGESAVERVLASGGGTTLVPDLVLLDLKLPGIDGFEVLRRLRADRRAALVPIVVLTSSLEERDIQQSYELGANSYVRKPTDFDEFLPLLQDLVRYWLILNQGARPGGGT